MSSSPVFHVLFDDDAKPWISFLKDTIRSHRQTHYEFRSTPVEDLLPDRSGSLGVEDSEVLLVILSPAHLAFLVNNQGFDYQGLVRGGAGQKGVIFLCGVDQVQLEGSDDLRGRFPWYSCWTKVGHSNADGLMDVVDRAAPFPSLAYELIPSSVRCESVSMVTASFSDVIAGKSSDLQMSLYVANGNEEEELKVTWVNDKTVRFKAPERKEGKARVRVLVNGTVVHGTEFLDYESSCELVSDMMQLYIHSMNHLFCSILSRSLLSADELDGLLFSVLNDEELKGIQPKAFEELFGIFRYSPKFKSQVELPTLLHLANKFELNKFKSWLKNLPDAALAACVRNSAGLESDDVNIFTGAKKQPYSSTSKPSPSNRQTGQIASTDCTSQQSNFDEEEDFYLVMEKQTMPCQKPNLNGGNDDDNEDDEDYLVMDKASVELQRKMSDKPVLKENDDDDNEDDEDYLVMDKTTEKQWKLCENETVDEDIYDLCTADSTAEEQEDGRTNEDSVLHVKPVTPNAKAFSEATNLRNMMIEQLPESLDHGQQRLIQLMNQFKAGELTMDEVNILFQEWKINNPQKQVHLSDRCSAALQMQSYTLPNSARRRTEHEQLAPVKGRGYAGPKDADLPPTMHCVDPISRNMHRTSVTLERRVMAPSNNKTGNYGNYKGNITQNLYSGNCGTDTIMGDGDSYSQVSPNKSSSFAPPLPPARKQALRQPNKSATLPPLPSRPRRN